MEGITLNMSSKSVLGCAGPYAGDGIDEAAGDGAGPGATATFAYPVFSAIILPLVRASKDNALGSFKITLSAVKSPGTCASGSCCWIIVFLSLLQTRLPFLRQRSYA